MRILILGPWPIAHARHGGQIRAESIIETYRERGHEVKFVGIYDPTNVPRSHTGRHDFCIDSAVMSYVSRSGQPWEISLWEAFADVPALYGAFEALVRDFCPDVVQFEEPYLWPVVRSLRNKGELARARIVHSSYNFETDYRKELARIAGKSDGRILRHVALQEAEISRECDLVVTVSDDDAASFRALNARHVVVARNGSRRIEPTEEALAAVDAYVGDTSFALFVSSAHPPNAEGLLNFVTGMKHKLPGKLLIGGTVDRLLEPHYRTHRLLRDAHILGMVDAELLPALLARACVILLPKTSGGGSNLKTSEALLANRPIVATSLAFTGFESWSDLSSVEIANESPRFWELVAQRLEAPRTPYNAELDERREQLLWRVCLAPMVDAVERCFELGIAERGAPAEIMRAELAHV